MTSTTYLVVFHNIWLFETENKLGDTAVDERVEMQKNYIWYIYISYNILTVYNKYSHLFSHVRIKQGVLCPLLDAQLEQELEVA